MENKEIKRKEIKKKSYERIINTNFQNIEDEDNILENESKFSVEIILYEEEIGIIIREIGETKDDNLDLYEKYYSYDELKEMNDIFAVKKNLGKIYDSLLAKFDGKVDVVSMEGDNIIINLKYMIDDSEIEVSLEIPLIQKNEDEVKNLKDSIIELKKQKKYYKKEVDKLKEEIRMLKEKENNISNDLNNIRKEMDYMKNFMKENFSYFSNQEEKSIEKPDLDVQVPPKLIKSDNIEYKELSKECPCIKEPTKIDIQNVEQKVEEKKEEEKKNEIKEEKQEEPIPLYKTPVPIPVVSTIGQPQISQPMSICSEENIINCSETTFLSIFKLDNKIKI